MAIQETLNDRLNGRHFRGRLFLYGLQQLKVHLSDRYEALMQQDNYTEDQLINLLGEYVLNPFDALLHFHGQAFVYSLFAIPGFANYILSEEILMTTEIMHRSSSGVPVAANEVFFYDSSSGIGNFDSNIHLPRIYVKVIEVIHLGLIDVLGQADKYTAASTRFLMRCWQNPYVNVSYPNFPLVVDTPMLSRSTVFGMCFTLAADARVRSSTENLLEWTRYDEIVPGMTIVQIFQTLMKDKVFLTNQTHDGSDQAMLETFFTHILKSQESHDYPPSLWVHVSPASRIHLLDIWHDWDPPSIITYEGKDVRSSFRDEILGNGSTTILFKLEAHFLKEEDSSSTTICDLRTKALIHDRLARLRTAFRPNVMLYVESMETAAHEQLAPTKLPSFPDELIALISDYALPEMYRL